MEKQRAQLKDTYEVIAASSISEYDRKVLSRLYQPIIGYGAVALFLTLNSELDGERTILTTSKTVDRLTSLMQSNCDDIRRFAMKLEAVGLLHTFIKTTAEGCCWLFELYAPLSPRDFLNHDVLALLFKDVMGQTEYERSLVYLTQYGVIEKDFKEITADFNDVFGRANLDHMSPNAENNKMVTHEAGQPNLGFDFDQLYAGLKEYQISKKIVTPEVAAKIPVYANAYNISVFDMRSILCACLDDKQNVDLKKLEIKCRDHAAVKLEPEPIRAKTNLGLSGIPELDEKIKIMNAATPSEYLRAKNKGRKPVNADLKLLEDLQADTGLPNGVINAILDYTLVQNDNRLNRAYMERLGGTLSRNGASDAYEAMMILNGNRTNKKAQKTESSNVNPTPAKEEIDIKEDVEILKQLRAAAKKQKEEK